MELIRRFSIELVVELDDVGVRGIIGVLVPCTIEAQNQPYVGLLLIFGVAIDPVVLLQERIIFRDGGRHSLRFVT